MPGISIRTPPSAMGPKLLTQNQVFGVQSRSRSKPGNDKIFGLHQSLHQRLRTAVDILRSGSEDEA